jgi:Cytochrome c biogenesis factor
VILLAELSLWVALLMSAWAALVSIAGTRLRRADLIESGARSARVTALMLVLAALGLWTALLRRDFSVAFVASHTTSNLPGLYAMAAFWSAEPGWSLFFALVLSLSLLFAARRGDDAGAYVTGLCALILAIVLTRVCVYANPFVRLDWIPSDGLGLLPSLQHPGVQLHLLLLFIGCALSVVAGVSGVAAIEKLYGAGQAAISPSSSWAFKAWLCATAAMLIGMWSAHAELGWTGSWMLYPAEGGEIFLWLALSARLLSARRGLYDIFVLALAGVCLFRAIPTVVSAPARFADQMSGSVMAALLVILCGGLISFLLLRRKTSLTNRTFGALAFLAGALLLGASVGAARWTRIYTTEISTGASRDLSDAFGRAQRVTLQSLSEYNVINRELTTALVSFTGSDGRKLVASEVARSVDSRGAATSPASGETGTSSSFGQDISVRVRSIPSRSGIVATIGFEPLVELAWVACVLLYVGGIIALRPKK